VLAISGKKTKREGDGGKKRWYRKIKTIKCVNKILNRLFLNTNRYNNIIFIIRQNYVIAKKISRLTINFERFGGNNSCYKCLDISQYRVIRPRNLMEKQLNKE